MEYDISPEEYQEAMKASREKFFPPRPLHHYEWSEVASGLTAVQESEADRGLPKGNHYALAEILYRLCGVRVNKWNMKEIAQDVLDTDYLPD